MWTLASYLAIAAFFLKAKPKKIFCEISITITGIYFLMILLNNCFGLHSKLLYDVFELFYKGNPVYWLLKWMWILARNLKENQNLIEFVIIFLYALENGFQIAIAFIAMKTEFAIINTNGKKKIIVSFIKNQKTNSSADTQNGNSEESEVLKAIPKEYKPITMWGYFGYEILFSIPLIGWIILIIKAITSKNKNVKNFARSYFCLLIIGIIASIICAINFWKI